MQPEHRTVIMSLSLPKSPTLTARTPSQEAFVQMRPVARIEKGVMHLHRPLSARWQCGVRKLPLLRLLASSTTTVSSFAYALRTVRRVAVSGSLQTLVTGRYVAFVYGGIARSLVVVTRSMCLQC